MNLSHKMKFIRSGETEPLVIFRPICFLFQEDIYNKRIEDDCGLLSRTQSL